MRPAHIRLIASAGVLAVALGVGTAFVVGRDNPAQPVAVATPTTTIPTDVVAGKDNGSGTDTTTPPKPPVHRDQQAAKAAAVTFLRELGMRDPVAASYRKTGSATAEVGLHPKAGEGGRLFDRVTTLVRLHRYTNGWVPTGAKAADIEVAQPLPFARIQSPLTVSGQSVSYEGTVHVTVTQDRRGPDRVLGKGFVNGGGTELSPFLGQIRFATPTPGVDAGWVVFSGDTGAGPGIIEASAVRVRFVNSDHKPRILGVITNPPAVGSARLVTLTGSGTLGIHVEAVFAGEVRALLVPSGTDGRAHARLLGVDSTANADGDHWGISWRYPNEPFSGHLLILASGRGGTTEHERIAVVHT
jgi:Immunoglobulin-like domain of bacterial spore germination